MTAFQRISGISEVDIDLFCDGERPHMKENLVTVVSYDGPFPGMFYKFRILRRMKRMGLSLIYESKKLQFNCSMVEK